MALGVLFVRDDMAQLVGGDEFDVGPAADDFLKELLEGREVAVGVGGVDGADVVDAVRADIGRFAPAEGEADAVEAVAYEVEIGLGGGLEVAVAHEADEAAAGAGALEAAPHEAHRGVVVEGYLLADGALDVADAVAHEAGLDFGAPLVGGGDERLGAEAEGLLEEVEALGEEAVVVGDVVVEARVEGAHVVFADGGVGNLSEAEGAELESRHGRRFALLEDAEPFADVEMLAAVELGAEDAAVHALAPHLEGAVEGGVAPVGLGERFVVVFGESGGLDLVEHGVAGDGIGSDGCGVAAGVADRGEDVEEPFEVGAAFEAVVAAVGVAVHADAAAEEFVVNGFGRHAYAAPIVGFDDDKVPAGVPSGDVV